MIEVEFPAEKASSLTSTGKLSMVVAFCVRVRTPHSQWSQWRPRQHLPPKGFFQTFWENSPFSVPVTLSPFYRAAVVRQMPFCRPAAPAVSPGDADEQSKAPLPCRGRGFHAAGDGRRGRK